MNQTTVYKKSEKGDEEIRTRKYGLSLDLRRILICVDGKSSVSAIIEKGTGLTNVAQSLEEFARRGYILIDEHATIASIKNELIAITQQTLGADAEMIISKIKNTPETREGLEATVRGCKKIVRLVIDERKAEMLMRRCFEILTQF